MPCPYEEKAASTRWVCRGVALLRPVRRCQTLTTSEALSAVIL
jgi:hypothetical protein